MPNDEEWRTVKVTLRLNVIEKLEEVTSRQIADIIDRLVKYEYKLKCTFIPILNRCDECGQEVRLYLPPSTRKKTLAWMKHAAVKCSICQPQSRWRRVSE